MKKLAVVPFLAVFAWCLIAATAGQAADPCQTFNLPNDPTNTPRFKLAAKDWPVNHGQASVCLWADDKMASLSFTIDDNIVPEHNWWIAQGNKYGWKFTWFVIVHYLQDKSSPGYFGTWADFRRLFSLGHDVQSHTYDHDHDDANRPDSVVDLSYRLAKKMIQDSIPGDSCITQAYPNGSGKSAIAAKYYIAARGVYGRPDRANQTWYVYSNGGAFDKQWIDNLLDSTREPLYWRGWDVLCLHDIGTGSTDSAKKAEQDSFALIMDYLKTKESDIWVDLYRTIAKYGQERDTRTLKVLSVAPSVITFSVTDSMNDTIYNYPLTVKVRVNNDWGSASAKQNNAPTGVKLITYNGNRYALVKAVPDRGTVTLTKSPASILTGPHRAGAGSAFFTLSSPRKGVVAIGLIPDSPGRIVVTLYDIKGRFIRTLSDGYYPDAPRTVTITTSILPGSYLVSCRSGLQQGTANLIVAY